MDDAAKLWPDEGMRWVQEPRKHAPGLDSMLTWAFRSKASRISFQPGHPVWVRIHGRYQKATRSSLDEGEFFQIVNRLCGADGVARLAGGNDFDTVYTIPIDRSTKLRFRLNAAPTRTSHRGGGNLVLRPIADLPPSLEEQMVEQEILDNYRPGEGFVVVSGNTGSGKSTLIAGMTVAKLLDPNRHYDIIEGAAPIEFLFERVHSPSSTIKQTEIPRDLPSFPRFIRGCMRREPTDIIVGECRDSETMGAAIQAAISGHTVMTTVLANSVRLTLERIASLCPAAERANAVAQSLRLVINQRLVPTVAGRRTALREFLVVDSTLRNAYLATDPQEWPALTQRAVDEQGQSYEAAIARALADGRISGDVAAVQRTRTA